MTNLPVSNDAFDRSREENGITLAEALTTEGSEKMCSYSSVVVMASLIGKTLTHLHRSEVKDSAEDVTEGEFWKRHRELDDILATTYMFLPAKLRLAGNLGDFNVIFLHLTLHSTIICLHQAAILKAEQNSVDKEIVRISTDRCYASASQIVDIWKMVSHIDISYMSPYVAFCLYVGARVFVHAFKKSPEEQSTKSNLQILLHAMEAHRKHNDITESFLIQLLVDLEGHNFDNVIAGRDTNPVSKRDMVSCHEALCCTTTNSQQYSVWSEGNSAIPVIKKHSATQPTYSKAHKPQNPNATQKAEASVTPEFDPHIYNVSLGRSPPEQRIRATSQPALQVLNYSQNSAWATTATTQGFPPTYDIRRSTQSQTGSPHHDPSNHMHRPTVPLPQEQEQAIGNPAYPYDQHDFAAINMMNGAFVSDAGQLPAMDAGFSQPANWTLNPQMPLPNYTQTLRSNADGAGWQNYM